jgi:dihydroorotate dehydrogenase (NAD+) catalytic subunit
MGMTIRWWCAAGTWAHSDPPPGFDVYVLKTATVQPRVNPCPLVLRQLADDGYLNRIGVRNPGLGTVLMALPDVPGERVVSILGFAPGEWAWLAGVAQDSSVPTLELNLSCPNTEAEPVGADADATGRAVRNARGWFRGRLGAKLPPTASVDVALACEAGGADYLCLTNTMGTPMGGLSGRPLRALALDCIARIAPHVSVPIVGGGGILSRADAQPYLDAGAAELFIGTGNILAGHVPEAAR